jgi:hypothetical protein
MIQKRVQGNGGAQQRAAALQERVCVHVGQGYQGPGSTLHLRQQGCCWICQGQGMSGTGSMSGRVSPGSQAEQLCHVACLKG